jgi:Tfp pilus assembly protein PilN
MRAVNLLPAEYAKSHGKLASAQLPLPGVLSDPRKLAPILLAVVLATIVAAGYVTQSRTVSDREQTLAELQAELAARPKPELAVAPSGDASIRLAAAMVATEARVPWEEVLQQFALVLPADVSITSLTATGTAGGFTLSGYTSSQPSVARLLVRLDEAPTLANVQLQSSVRSETEGRTNVQFTVIADVVPEGGSS